MTTVSLCSVPTLQFFDNRGVPAAGGSVLTQVGGVNYPTYQDSGGATALPNPIPLNARGEISNATGATCQLFLVTGQTYTFTVYDANSNQLDSFAYMVAAATSADIANLQSQITAFSTSFTTGALTVTGLSTLHAVTCTTLSASGAATLTGGATLGANLAMGGNAITGASAITASGVITAGSFVSTGATPTPAWSIHNAAARSTNGIINYQTQDILSAVTYASGTVTIGSGNTGTYLVMATAEVGYNGGAAGANATIQIFKNGSNTGYQASWQENNNTTEHSTITVCALITTTLATDTIGIQFSTTSNGNVYATSGSFVGRFVGP